MPWQHYRLTFRLLSPLHVGYRRTGNLMQTRPYVPGRLLWAALTARLTRNAGQGNNAQAYQDTGKAIQRHFRFGYLWPSLDGEHPCFPWAHKDFDYLFLDSYTGTPIASTHTAEEGMLHQIEYLAPRTRDNRQVYLVGDLWVKEGALPPEIRSWQNALRHIQLGGERGYGWGRVALEQCEAQGKGHGRLTIIPDIQWAEKDDEIILTVQVGVPLPAHALADPTPPVQGQVEPLLGWGWHGGTYRLGEAQIAFVPGARPTTETRFVVGPTGRTNGRWVAKFVVGHMGLLYLEAHVLKKS